MTYKLEQAITYHEKMIRIITEKLEKWPTNPQLNDALSYRVREIMRLNDEVTNLVNDSLDSIEGVRLNIFLFNLQKRKRGNK